MSVLFPSLLWIGLPLLAVPILIHILNPRRQRRIRWAAMEFLLESQRRNKHWILLTQLLLLLSRIAIVALVVLMLAHVVLEHRWAELFGRAKFHHVVLLDDSYSMSDRWDVTTVFDEAKRVAQSVVDRATAAAGEHQLTLVTFSEAAQLSAGSTPPFFQEILQKEPQRRLTAYLESLPSSETDVGPLSALEAVERLPLVPDEASLAVYVISDFRARNLQDSTALADQLRELDQLTDEVHLVQCVRETRPNLAITSLVSESGVRAAGVEMWMNITVANYGEKAATNVTVRLEQDGQTLPALALGEIPAREERTHRFRLRFLTDGPHWLAAELGPDPVAVDNRRYFACNLKAAQPVLLVSYDYGSQDVRHLAVALRPSTSTQTGWLTRVASPKSLQNAEELAQYAAICLLDVPQLDPIAIKALEEYVRSGGGLAWFVGSGVDRAFYNENLYRDGKGIFPVPLLRPTQLLHRANESLPDLTVSDHRLFRIFAGQRNSILPLLRIDYYYALEDSWPTSDEETAQVIARLRNDAPLVIEKPLGDGIVVAQLSKLSSEPTPLGSWTNWSSSPAFPVWAHELVGYLSSFRRPQDMRLVGQELTLAVPENDFQPTFRFLTPGEDEETTEVLVQATADAGTLTGVFGDTARSGIYQVELETKQGAKEQRVFAVNVAPGEGDLEVLNRRQLAGCLGNAPYEFHYASEMQSQSPLMAGFHLQDTLLYIVLGLLICEQLLAYYASYHGRRVRSSPR